MESSLIAALSTAKEKRMSQGTLLNHRGAREVTRNDLVCMEAPPPTDTWFPLRHFDVLTAVENTLDSSGFRVRTAQLSVAKSDMRFFGVLDIASEVAEGVSLSVGLRNSCDKSFPIGFCVGTRVFVCDNLAFSSEIVIAKRHTRFGENRFHEGVANAVAALHQYRDVEAARIETLQQRTLPDHEADSLILRAGEKGIVGWRQIPKVIAEWREPSHEEFRTRTAYSLLNCFTEVLKPRFRSQPNKTALETIRLQKLLTN